MSKMNECIQGLPWQGIHHIALVTNDLDATLQFYSETLGMEVGDILGHKQLRGRHAFVKAGDLRGLGLHFFENTESEQLSVPEGGISFRLLPGALQHISFHLPNEEHALLLMNRLDESSTRRTEIVSLGSYRQMLFYDNNGIMLEAIWDKV